jgi:hypothetical protein
MAGYQSLNDAVSDRSDRETRKTARKRMLLREQRLFLQKATFPQDQVNYVVNTAVLILLFSFPQNLNNI